MSKKTKVLIGVVNPALYGMLASNTEAYKPNMTYPGTGSNIVSPVVSSIAGGQQGNNRKGVNEDPDKNNHCVEHHLRWTVSPYDGKVSVNSDRCDKETGCQVSIGVEKALDKACRGFDEDASFVDPRQAEKESSALVHIGNDEVEDEDEELVRRVVFSLFYALHTAGMGGLACFASGSERSIVECKVRDGLRLGDISRDAAGSSFLA
jgi:hypothetical protein